MTTTTTTTTTTFSKGYKVTLYSDSLRAIALYAVQGDSVNTSIIHLYLTLPRNERVHGLSKIIGINKVVGQVGFVRVGRIRK